MGNCVEPVRDLQLLFSEGVLLEPPRTFFFSQWNVSAVSSSCLGETAKKDNSKRFIRVLCTVLFTIP